MSLCPKLPLKKLRSNDLIIFLNSILQVSAFMNLDEIYLRVLNHFGDMICRPDLICQNSNRGESEYKHTVRWTLQDGKKKFGFYSDGKGNWSKK